MSERLFHCPSALIGAQWIDDCIIGVDQSGTITTIERGQSDNAERLSGPVIPGMVNLHSHIHQRLIAGLTGYRSAGADSFWTWREQMYGAINMFSARELELLAAFAFMELLEGGYTTTGEFHYPHRLLDSDPLQTSRVLLGAADQAGMALTLLPVWYRYGGFGRQQPSQRQHPFVLTLEELAGLIRTLRDHTRGTVHIVGVAPHSLRAVDVADLSALLETIDQGPVHLHISEQPAELEQCLGQTGRTPIELLTEHITLDRRWCLIHATHATEAELEHMAASEAIVGLCPTTEADLGDGLFPVRRFIDSGGRFGIGSDSNLVVDAPTELRLLDWGQRLVRHQRNVLCDGGEHLGRRLWRDTALAGADALQQPAGELAVGRRADFVVLNASHPLLAGLEADHQLDTLVMAGAPGLIDQVWTAGQRWVQGGRHDRREALASSVAELRRRLVERERP